MQTHLLDLPLVERVRTVHSASVTQRSRRIGNGWRVALVASVLLNLILLLAR